MSMTAAQLAEHYHVHVATIGRAITRANLPKARGAVYDDAQVAEITKHLTRLQVAAQGKTQRKQAPAQRASQPKKQFAPRPPAPAVQVAAQPPAQVAPQAERNLQEEVAQLRAQVAHLQAQLATHDYLISIVIGWGRNAAKIIRTLWHRMPDYQPGDTPPEFPAIRKDQIDEDGQRTEKLLAELEQENEEWAKKLAELVRKAS